MRRNNRLRWAVLGLFVVVASIGCNPLTAPFFFLYGFESKKYAECPLVPNWHDTDKKRPRDDEVKVLVIISSSANLPVDFIGVERTLGNMFEHQLTKGAKENKEKISVIPINKVEKFKAENPDWKGMSAHDLGKQFNADYVIDLEINSLSMRTTSRTLYAGRGAIGVAVYDIHKGDREAIYSTVYTCEYPKGRWTDATETTATKFRLDFLKRMAIDLSWKFVPHLVADDVPVD